MAAKIDISLATSEQIEETICKQLVDIRISRNLTQAQLAKAAGVSTKTITNMEHAKGISLDTFIRVLAALGLQSHLLRLLPDPTIRPVERVRNNGIERKRVKHPRSQKTDAGWSWGDEA